MLMVVKELRFRAPIEDVNFMRTERTRRYLSSNEDFVLSPTNSQGSGGSLYSPEKDDREVTKHQNDAVEAQEPEKDDREVAEHQGDPIEAQEPHTSEHGDYSQPELAKNIIELLSALPDNQLTGFRYVSFGAPIVANFHVRWDMGTSCPWAICGNEGYLLNHQTFIKRLSLVTRVDDDWASSPLAMFISLREISWKGLQSRGECHALRAFLQVHHDQLESLELDFMFWGELMENLESSYYADGPAEDQSYLLQDLIFPQRDDNYQNFLNNLQKLSLRGASFDGSWEHILRAFNMENVEELRLIDCRLTVEMLHELALDDITLEAGRVELVIDSPEMDDPHPDPVHDFLAVFWTLEDLFLLFDTEFADWCYVKMILQHRDTLRRLVYHRRQCCLTSTRLLLGFGEYHDVSSLTDERDFDDDELSLGDNGDTDEQIPSREKDFDELSQRENGDTDEHIPSREKDLVNILQSTQLQSAGFCIRPSEMQKCLEGRASSIDSLKVLHLRFTGKKERRPRFFNDVSSAQKSSWKTTQRKHWRKNEDKEMKAFADWAFGSDGFPNLKILASGDFSYGDRFADGRTLWCRKNDHSTKKRPWRKVKNSDVAENELIEANMDMLSACPVSPLFYNWGDPGSFPGLS